MSSNNQVSLMATIAKCRCKQFEGNQPVYPNRYLGDLLCSVNQLIMLHTECVQQISMR